MTDTSERLATAYVAMLFALKHAADYLNEPDPNPVFPNGDVHKDIVAAIELAMKT